MKEALLPVYSLQDQKLLRDRQAVKNYLEHWQKMKTTKTTNEIFEDLEQDALSIIGSSTSLLDAIKERDKKILDLELQLETINRPLKK